VPDVGPLEGIDVSRWQATINWAQVKAAGKQFVVMKATEGTGYVDPNYEGILRLHPDLVITLAEHAAARSFLQSMHITVLQIDHKSVDDIVNSITVIGNSCGAKVRADSLTRRLRARMARIKAATAGLSRPRVLISVGRAMGSLSDLCVAGKGTYYAEMVELAGGANALNIGGIAFPMVSLEGICQINPQVVIDMIPDGSNSAATPKAVISEWKKAENIDAVKDGRIYVFTQDFAEIPGPRFIEILEQMAKVIHPELKWK